MLKMSFTKASFQVHSLLQTYINLPYLADKRRNCLVQNAKYSNNSKKQVVFYLAIVILILLQQTYFIHLGYLFFSWKNNPMNLKLDQVTYSAINVAIEAIINSSNLMIVTQHHILQQLISEVCRLGNGINALSNLKIGNLKFKEAFIYSLYISILTMSVGVAFAPFVIDWEPIQLVFGTNICIKVLSACIYGFEGMYSGGILVSTFLLLFTMLENMELYTKEHLGTSRNFSAIKFSKSYKQFRMFQTISKIANSIFSGFLTVLIAVGVLGASVSTYVALTLWDSLGIFIYMTSLALSFCCYTIAVFMTQYANIPRKNVIKFGAFWKHQSLNKIERKFL